MADFNVRSDAVDVEQIMRQIRARIREKRGVDYTEAELQQLASVKLEKFLDPRGLRSDLVEQFRKHRIVSPEPPKYEFEDTTMYDTHRGVLRFIRKTLHPILKLFINPNPLIHAMHVQAQINAEFHRRFREREEMDPLFYEVIHNLVLEVTRLGIEAHNLKMRVESLSSRMDFDERRGRSLEGVVQYRPGAAGRPASPQAQPQSSSQPTHRERSSDNARPDARPEAARAEGARPEGARPETARPETARVESARPDARPDAPRPDGAAPDAGSAMSSERRRRRRRRRRRPGTTMGDRQNPNGLPGAPGGTGLPAHAEAPDRGDDDGPEGPESDDEAADQ